METSNKKKIDIVVAHYDEDLSWLDQVDKTYVGEIFIYNKKGDTQYRTLPNIGQDPHTFLTHIIENYNNLPDGIVFLQGDPFTNGNNTVLPNNVGDINFFLEELQTRKNTTNYKRERQDFGLYDGKIQYWNNRELIDSGTNFYDWFYDVFGDEVGTNFIYWGQQFGVSKELIESKDLIFYQDLIKYFGQEEGLNEISHYIERSWCQIFKIKPDCKLAMIQVWIGPIPEYFKYHFETIKNLDYIDFLFFTDQEIEEKSDNFKKIYIDKDKIEQLIEVKTGQSVPILNNKKVCDLKATFGHLFEDYLWDYSHYGVYDIDTLFGDVNKFISKDLFNYDFVSFGTKSYVNRLSGPFIIFKNSEKVKKSYLCDYFFEMMKVPEVTCFEENYFFEKIVKSNFSYQILYDVCNFIEKEGSYSEFKSIWDQGILKINNEEKMLNHFYYKNHVKLQFEEKKVITNFEKTLLEDFYWVTCFSENYQNIADNLLESINRYSNRKILIFTINYEIDDEFRSKYNSEQFIFRTLNIEEGQKDYRGRDFNILSLKPVICLESIRLFQNQKFIYIDSDIYLTRNADNLKKYTYDIDNYPIYNSHIHDTIFISNIREDENWTDVLGLLLEKLNIDVERLYPRRKGNLFIYDNKSTWFFEEQINIFRTLIDNRERGILELHDEDSANAILTKHQLIKKLPLVDIEENYSIDDNFFEKYSYHMSSISPNVVLPENKNEVYVFHGFKSGDDYDKIRDNYCKSVLKEDDILIEYLNNTLCFKKNNFLWDKNIESIVNFVVKDNNDIEIFTLGEQNIFNYSLFYISDFFLESGIYKLEVIENIRKNIIYQTYFEIK